MSKYTMIVTMADGSLREFAPPIRAVCCELPLRGASGRKWRSPKWSAIRPVDIIDAETGEVLVPSGQWLSADVPFSKIEIDITKVCKPGGLADLRNSLTITA